MEGISLKPNLAPQGKKYFSSQRGAPAAPRGSEMPERLKSTSFNIHPMAHIVIDTKVCNGCKARACIWACPAELFVAKSDGGILFNYENCLECGTCYVVCDEEGAITWSYPPGGFGVVFYLG